MPYLTPLDIAPGELLTPDVLKDHKRCCNLCNDPIVYGDERNMWIGYHTAWYHRFYYAVKRFFLA